MDITANINLTGFGNARPTFEPVDLVLFKQKLDAFGVALDGFGFIGLHLGPIYRGAFAFKSHFGEIMRRLMQHMAGMQQGF